MYGKKKSSFQRLFATDSKDACESAIKNGGIATMVSAALTTVFAIAGFFTTSADPALNFFLDPWQLVDVVLLLVLGFFIFRKSRVASTIMLIYFTLGKLFIWYQVGAPSGLVTTIIFFLFYFTAMKATYIWHSTYKNITRIENQTEADTELVTAAVENKI